MTGLSREEINLRIEKKLVNYDVQIKTKSVSQIVKSKIFNLFNFLNFFLAGLILFVGSYKNMAFICVVFWNILIGIVQEVRAKKTVDRLSLLSSEKATVIRDGKEEQISIYELVLDDVMLLNAGNQIPADAVVIEGECLVNESLITGESDSILKKQQDTLLSGSFVVSGKVYVRVVHVAHDNYVNQITGSAKYIKKPNSQILNSINFVIRIISFCIVPLGIMIFVKQFNLEGNGFKDTVVATVAAVISMIPSGLVLLTSVVLAVSVMRLARHNTLVKEMFCIETLSRVDTICLDKTGTITVGDMRLEKIEFLKELDENYFNRLMKTFIFAIDDTNQTAIAVKKYFEQFDEYKSRVNKITPFSSETKSSSAIFDDGLEVTLGAPEFVLNNIDENTGKILECYQEQGKRVLCLLINNEAHALLVISDIIRKEAKSTIKFFKEQGVDIKIISGDNPKTVSRISGEVSVDNSDKYIDLSEIEDDARLCEIVNDYTIFGRVSPNQKLELIKALKSKNHTVAMVGDGANDVMALKEADCSIAMQSGSDAARCASQLVLLDSNFAAMPKIVAEGRRTINNIERSAVLYLSKTIYATILAFIFLFINCAYPFQPIQLTLIGSLTIGIPSFILALEPNHELVYGSFLTNVLKKAIPGGISVIVNVIIGLILSYFFDLSKEDTSTLCTILAAVAAMIILLDVCRPFDRLRTIMFLMLSYMMIFALNIAKHLFGISKLKFKIYLFIIICGVTTFVLHTVAMIVLDKIFCRKMSNT